MNRSLERPLSHSDGVLLRVQAIVRARAQYAEPASQTDAHLATWFERGEELRSRVPLLSSSELCVPADMPGEQRWLPRLRRSDGVQRDMSELAFDAGEAAVRRRDRESPEAVEERRRLPWPLLLSLRPRLRLLPLRVRSSLLLPASPQLPLASTESSAMGLGMTHGLARGWTPADARGRSGCALAPADGSPSSPSCCQNSARSSIPLLSLLASARRSTPVFLPLWAVASARLVVVCAPPPSAGASTSSASSAGGAAGAPARRRKANGRFWTSRPVPGPQWFRMKARARARPLRVRSPRGKHRPSVSKSGFPLDRLSLDGSRGGAAGRGALSEPRGHRIRLPPVGRGELHMARAGAAGGALGVWRAHAPWSSRGDHMCGGASLMGRR